MATRDFDAMLAQQGRTRQTFRIGGQEFTIRAKLPWRTFSALLASMQEENVDEYAKTVEFFNLVLVRADRERFRELLNASGDDEEDEDEVIDPEQMNLLSDWLLEYYTGKRQGSSDSSSPGSAETGDRQNVVSLNPRAASTA
jgi:hypothetical protein